jgi:hypothetical protein
MYVLVTESATLYAEIVEFFIVYGTVPKKKLTSWARAQEKKPKGWKSITNLTAETSSYPTLGTVSLSPSTVLCTIEDSEIDIGNIESKWLLTKRLLTATTIGLGMLDTTPSIKGRVKTPRAKL